MVEKCPICGDVINHIYHCPICNGSFLWDPVKERWFCNNCGFHSHSIGGETTTFKSKEEPDERRKEDLVDLSRENRRSDVLEQKVLLAPFISTIRPNSNAGGSILNLRPIGAFSRGGSGRGSICPWPMPRVSLSPRTMCLIGSIGTVRWSSDTWGRTEDRLVIRTTRTDR